MDILSLVVDQLTNSGLAIATEKIKRQAEIIRILDAIGLKPEIPPSDFDGVYAYSLVEYGLGKPKPIIEFFRHSFIKDAFRKSFEGRDPSILDNEAENLLDWSKIGKDVHKIDYDPRREFSRFTSVFHSVADRTRTVAEVKRDQKIDDMQLLLSSITSQLEVLESNIQNDTGAQSSLENLRAQFAEAAAEEDRENLLQIMQLMSLYKATFLNDDIGLYELAEYPTLTNETILQLLYEIIKLDPSYPRFRTILELIYRSVAN